MKQVQLTPTLFVRLVIFPLKFTLMRFQSALKILVFGLFFFFPPFVIGAEITLNAGLPAIPPFAYPTPDKASRGVVVELYRMLEKEAGVTFKIHLVPYARTLAQLKNGTLDVAILFRNQSIEKYVSYVGRVSFSKVIILSGKDKALNKYEDLYTFREIAVLRKASFETRFDQDDKLNKYPVENYKQSVQMLNKGRVDAAVGSLSGLQNAIDTLGIKTDEWNQPYELGQKEWWLHFSNKSSNQNLIPALKMAVEKIYKPNLIYELYQKQMMSQ